MKRLLSPLALVIAGLPLSACADDGYGRSGLNWTSYPYSGWYDGYYGSIFDGYWGTDNVFYFRLRDNELRYHRDAHRHFRRDGVDRDFRFRRFDGAIQSPPRRGTRMPRFPGGEQRRRP
ncbi:hypothetical protein [Novosphingobium sp.]|uniref:hypothetical protein n=1 Tax=Novosphingobium sp. TaxID=1874826 RepID=UPI0025DD2E6D|nr:hypothetical protein [Novosphingobium sp.]